MSSEPPAQPHRCGEDALPHSTSEEKRVLLAYSGDMKGSCVLRWLLDEGYVVYVLVCDIGQHGCLNEVKERALKIGAAKVFVEDVKNDFVLNFVYRTIQANALYDGRLPLGTALSRPCIAKRQIEVARREQCQYVAHGASGATSDHCRFELVYYALDYIIKIVAPFRDKQFMEIGRTRDSLLRYAQEKNLPCNTVAGDMNLYTLTLHGANLEDPSKEIENDTYLWTVDPETAPGVPEFVEISFKNGIPSKVQVFLVGCDGWDGTQKVDETATDAVEMLKLLNKLGARHGVGRIDMVASAQIGVKFRNVVECPGGTILRAAHHDLERLVMDREVRRLRDMMSPKFAELVYNGFWCSPEMEFINSAVTKSQEMVGGTVRLRVFKGTVMAMDRWSGLAQSTKEKGMPFSSPEDTCGFVRCSAVRLRTAAELAKKQQSS